MRKKCRWYVSNFSDIHLPELYFYDKKYKSYAEALKHENSIAALGLLFKQSEGFYGDVIFLDNNVGEYFRFYSKSLIPDKTNAYYFYNGSIIESECHEPATWIVNKRIR